MSEKESLEMKPLFSSAFTFRGKHAIYVKALTNKFDSKYSQGIFTRNLDVYLIAPVIGKLYNRKGKIDSEDAETKVFLEQINLVYDQLMFNYRLIMLLESRRDVELEERCNRAFRYDKNMEKRGFGDQVYESYLLGGVEVLYEKLIDGAVTPEDYVKKMYDFVNEYYELFGASVSPEEIYALCKSASKG